MYIAGLLPCRINKHSTPYFIRLYISSFHHGFVYPVTQRSMLKVYAARDPWSPPSMDGDPIHGSLHMLIDSVFTSHGRKSMVRVKNPQEGWVS